MNTHKKSVDDEDTQKKMIGIWMEDAHSLTLQINSDQER